MPASDYSLVTYEDGKTPRAWCWEIKREGKSLGVRLSGGGYQSQAAAEFAGQRELQRFLADLIHEERRKR